MNAIREFESRFQEEVLELLILANEDVGGAGVIGDYLKPSIDFIASVNLKTDEFIREKGRLEWMIKNEKGIRGWGYDFKQFQIYHLKARKNIPVEVMPGMLKTLNNCYMVVELIEDGVTDSRLEALKEELSKPVVIEDEIGTFTLQREYSTFEGDVDWLGEDCSVFLDTDEEDGDTAKITLDILRQLYQNLENWDKKLRFYAAEHMTDLANDWLEDVAEEEEEVTPFTKETFAEKLYISELSISTDGGLTAYYLDEDDVFLGHCIIIDANINGEISGADLAG